MIHQRKIIRDAIVSILDTGDIVPEGRVYSNRARSISDKNLPVIAIYNRSEESERYQSANSKLLRTLDVAIEAFVLDSSEEDLDDSMDALAKGIEDAIKADDSLNGTANDAVLSATEFEMDSKGNKAVGIVRLIYTVRYFY